MASGTLANLASSAFVPTRVIDAERICRNLLSLPAASFSILDPTSGEGDLLLPFAAHPRAQLYGVELSAERAAESRARLPRALIVTSAFEHVRITENALDLIVSNPPYLTGELGRLEYAIVRDATAALRPGSPHVTIVPARQWDGTMARFWARNYTQVQCWRLDDDEFAKYTQIVVAGVKRERPLQTPEALELNRIRGFRYRVDADKPEACPWAQGFAPDILPDAPIAEPYIVTPGGIPVEITVLRQPGEGDAFRLGSFQVHVLETPGHTLGHIAYWLPAINSNFPHSHCFYGLIIALDRQIIGVKNPFPLRRVSRLKPIIGRGQLLGIVTICIHAPDFKSSIANGSENHITAIGGDRWGESFPACSKPFQIAAVRVHCPEVKTIAGDVRRKKDTTVRQPHQAGRSIALVRAGCELPRFIGALSGRKPDAKLLFMGDGEKCAAIGREAGSSEVIQTAGNLPCLT